MRNMRNPFTRSLVTAGSALGLALGLAPAAHAAISGVCPDGSMYIVQQESQIPCAASKQVEPSEMPPIQPEVTCRRRTRGRSGTNATNPNNPYNAVDSPHARCAASKLPPVQGQAAHGQPGQGQPARGPTAVDGPRRLRPRPRSPIVRSARSIFGLSDRRAARSLRDHRAVTGARADARIARRTADGKGVFEVSHWRAHGLVRERRIQEAWRSRGGLGGATVLLLFAAHSKRPEGFFANFTFVQGHLTYPARP